MKDLIDEPSGHVVGELAESPFAPAQGLLVALALDGIADGSCQKRAAHLGLGKIVLRSCLKRAHRERFVGARGENHDGDVRTRAAQRRQRVETLAVRQAQVQKDHVNRCPLDTFERLPEALGGSVARARDHFTKAVEIQKGLSPGPHVALAVGVSVPAQDKAEFTRLLNEALAIDPEKNPSMRLVTLITQRRARALLDQVNTLFAK